MEETWRLHHVGLVAIAIIFVYLLLMGINYTLLTQEEDDENLRDVLVDFFWEADSTIPPDLVSATHDFEVDEDIVGINLTYSVMLPSALESDYVIHPR